MAVAPATRATLARKAPKSAAVPELIHLLAELYARQRLTNHSAYLGIHSSPKFIRGRALAYAWYAPFLPKQGRVLDWGCMHAPDSCLMRHTLGDSLDLHGCDFRHPDEFPVFDECSAIEYRQLTHPVQLPYESDSFDAVVAAGCLEHVAMDYESLKELYRVLKPQGVLIITYLPNHWSYMEFYLRRIRRAGFHNRLYTTGATEMLLKHTGFLPEIVRPASMGLEARFRRILGDGRIGQVLRTSLLTALPVHRFSSTLCAVARKATMM